MIRAFTLTGFALLIGLAPGLGCNSAEACDDDSLECYCMRNPQNCENEPEEAVQATPDASDEPVLTP